MKTRPCAFSWPRLLTASLALWGVTLGFVGLGGPSAALAAEAPVPRNPFLAESPWPMTHANPYNQDSTEEAGPTESAASLGFAAQRWLDGPVPITLAVSSVYRGSATRVVWGNTRTSVIKWRLDSGGLVSIGRFARPVVSPSELSGAYSLVDIDGKFFVPRDLTIDVFADATPGDPNSGITWHALDLASNLPPVRPDERFVGLNLTYDGMLAGVTNFGLTVIATRTGSVLGALRLGDDLEVSNSLAVDEDGGVYVLTHRYLHKLRWNGSALTELWRSPYASEDVASPGRLGKGSGTTPTLMGTGTDDRLVVFADGRQAMHLIFLWRDEAPLGKFSGDPRVAADIPITFGKAAPVRALTEQSVVVSGRRAFVVDNSYGKISRLERAIARRRGATADLATIYLSNTRPVAPYGVEQVAWDPLTQTARTRWARPDISCPNGIPMMSRGANLAYCIGQRQSRWTVEALDWDTGATSFSVPLTKQVEDNSFYAGLEVIAHGTLMTGTYGGALAVTPKR